MFYTFWADIEHMFSERSNRNGPIIGEKWNAIPNLCSKNAWSKFVEIIIHFGIKTRKYIKFL